MAQHPPPRRHHRRRDGLLPEFHPLVQQGAAEGKLGAVAVGHFSAQGEVVGGGMGYAGGQAAVVRLYRRGTSCPAVTAWTPTARRGVPAARGWGVRVRVEGRRRRLAAPNCRPAVAA